MDTCLDGWCHLIVYLSEHRVALCLFLVLDRVVYDEQLCRVASDTSFQASRTALTTELCFPQCYALDVEVRLNTEYILSVLVELIPVATAEAFCESALVAGYDDCILRMFTKEPAR